MTSIVNTKGRKPAHPRQPKTVVIAKYATGQKIPNTTSITCVHCSGSGKRRARVIVRDTMLPVHEAAAPLSLHEIPPDHWLEPIVAVGVQQKTIPIRELSDHRLRVILDKLIYNAKVAASLTEPAIRVAMHRTPQFPYLVAAARLRGLETGSLCEAVVELLRARCELVAAAPSGYRAKLAAAITACDEAIVASAVSSRLAAGAQCYNELDADDTVPF